MPVTVDHFGEAGFLGGVVGLPVVEEAFSEHFVFLGAFVGEDDGFGEHAVGEGSGGGAQFAFGGNGALGFAREAAALAATSGLP